MLQSASGSISSAILHHFLESRGHRLAEPPALLNALCIRDKLEVQGLGHYLDLHLLQVIVQHFDRLTAPAERAERRPNEVPGLEAFHVGKGVGHRREAVSYTHLTLPP